jgi:hypothetical protein
MRGTSCSTNEGLGNGELCVSWSSGVDKFGCTGCGAMRGFSGGPPARGFEAVDCMPGFVPSPPWMIVGGQVLRSSIVNCCLG